MNSVCAPSRTPASDAGGFSLVEVTMAMGIFIFGLVAILGLFPTALQTSRASLDLFTAAQLSRAVVADLERGEFSALSPSLQDEHFFNDRGKEIPESPDAACRVKVNLESMESVNLLRAKVTVIQKGHASSPRTFSYLLFNND